jgi:hypothetical protein
MVKGVVVHVGNRLVWRRGLRVPVYPEPAIAESLESRFAFDIFLENKDEIRPFHTM